MDNLFLLLVLLSIFALIIGMIKPNLVIKWGNPEKRNRKNVLKVYGLAIIVFFVLFGMNLPSDEVSTIENNTIEKKQVEQIQQEQEDEYEIEETIKTEDAIEEGKEEKDGFETLDAMDVNYLLMWHDYNDDNFTDKYIRIAGKIDYIGKSTINIKEGLSGITGNIYLQFDENNIGQLESVSVGDYIIVTGKSSGKLAGQIGIENANIEASGDQALQKADQYKKEADRIFEEERIEAQKIEKEAMADYSNKAITIKYEDLVRDPNKYKGDIIKVTIKISQIMSGGFLTEAGYAGKQGGDEWFIKYTLPEYSPRILEGDTIRFYGEFDDVTEMKRALTNTSVFIPKLNAKYFELIK